jgi:hypothetical protein
LGRRFSEFKALRRHFQLTRLCQRPRHGKRARPANPKAKRMPSLRAEGEAIHNESRGGGMDCFACDRNDA